MVEVLTPHWSSPDSPLSGEGVSLLLEETEVQAPHVACTYSAGWGSFLLGLF